MNLNLMRFLTDENISPKVVTYLREKGADVFDVKELGWNGKTDKEILDKALSDKRMILTCDRDFGSSAVYGQVPHYGIIFIRPGNLIPSNIIKLIEKLTQKIPFKKGMIVILTEEKIRIRYR